ncbi:MAG: cysteine--tRNA ligase, partial [Candidatus Poribacteria bacterium]|nr:cysteine--tRNA ligase [Candidatus Poribacteria bacterium]
LEYKGYAVKLVQNLTDIDDKIINRANEQGISPFQLAQKYVDAYFEDSQKLGIRLADVHPRATEHISEMVSLIQTLIGKDVAYDVDGDVYYRVNNFAEYGKLSHRKPEELLAGARVEIDERKEDPRDFDLWKKSKAGEPSWDSPWGKGRPGWHIECSAMAMKHLGETIDIHAGGHDLQFPHHENEIAQSEVVTGKAFANYWMHVAFLRIGGQRMGKSKENFIFVRDALRKHSPEAIRHFLISAQYRHPQDYNPISLQESSSAIRRLHNCLDALKPYRDGVANASGEAALNAAETSLLQSLHAMRYGFESAMDDDFNTAAALGVIFKFVGEVNLFLAATEGRPSDSAIRVLNQADKGLVEICETLGIYGEHEAASDEHAALTDQLMALIMEIRQDARQRKDWETADKIRDRLKALNIELQDARSETTWKIIRGDL